MCGDTEVAKNVNKSICDYLAAYFSGTTMSERLCSWDSRWYLCLEKLSFFNLEEDRLSCAGTTKHA